MRKLRDVLRLRLSAQLSLRQIRDSLRLSLGAVQKITHKAEELGLDWPAIEQLDDRQLAQAIYRNLTPERRGLCSYPTGRRYLKNSTTKM